MDQWQRYSRSIAPYLKHVSAKNFDYSVNISLQHNYIYVETPKVGCSTIKANLQVLETGCLDHHWRKPMDVHDRDFSPLLRPSQVHDFPTLASRPDFYRFCFVRNPYTRLLSCYLDKIQGNKPPKADILNAFGLPPTAIDADISFADFILAVSRQSPGEMNSHWRPQYHQTFQDSIRYDFIGRFEQFQADLDRVLQRLHGRSSPRPAQGATHATGAGEKLAAYYTQALLAEVANTYAADFDHFGYTAGSLPHP